tara:strand:- start:93 stop:836 length:744 start_codon:yes stop_codon:yes gene_type:complete
MGLLDKFKRDKEADYPTEWRKDELEFIFRIQKDGRPITKEMQEHNYWEERLVPVKNSDKKDWFLLFQDRGVSSGKIKRKLDYAWFNIFGPGAFLFKMFRRRYVNFEEDEDEPTSTILKVKFSTSRELDIQNFIIFNPKKDDISKIQDKYTSSDNPYYNSQVQELFGGVYDQGDEGLELKSYNAEHYSSMIEYLRNLDELTGIEIITDDGKYNFENLVIAYPKMVESILKKNGFECKTLESKINENFL